MVRFSAELLVLQRNVFLVYVVKLEGSIYEKVFGKHLSLFYKDENIVFIQSFIVNTVV